MKKLLLLPVFLLCTILHAQDISSHIPKSSTYIVMINPAAHVLNGDMTQVNGLDMFTRTNDYGSGYTTIYGDQDLKQERQESLSKMFKDVFSNPKITGVDTTRKIYIFNQTPDSIHYWAYLLPISDAATFGNYVSANLFSEKKTPVVSGYSTINDERITIGWTKTYAVIILADYDYSSQSNDIYSYMQAIMDSTSVANEYASVEAMREADSTAAANQYRAEHDPIISDSIRKARTEELAKEEQEMLLKLANDSTPEEYYSPEMEPGHYPLYDYGDDEIQKKKDSLVARLALKQLDFLINTLTYEESVQSIANFREVNTEPSDAVYWYNYGEMMQQYYEKHMSYHNYYEYSGLGPDTMMIHNMWQGSYIASVMHFEGNVAKMEQRSYFSPAMQQHVNGMYSGRVDKKMFRYVKGENLLSFVAMSVDMEKFLKFSGSVYRESMTNSMSGFANYYMMVLDMYRVFIDDKTLYNLLDGQFLFAITDLKPYTASYVTYDYDDNFNKTEIVKEKTETRPEFVLVAGIGKEKKAAEIIALIERAGLIKKQNKQYYLINMPGEYDIKMFLAIQNGMLIITNNEDLVVNNLEHGYKKSKAMDKKLVKLGRKSALVGYWNGKKSFELLKKNSPEPLTEEDKKALDVLEQEINSGVVIGKKAKNGVQRIDVKLELNDPKDGKKQTSFVRFFRLLNSLFLIRTDH